MPLHPLRHRLKRILSRIKSFGYFAPQPVASIAGAITILFQGSIFISGNLSWLNFLTMILAISPFDDRSLSLVPFQEIVDKVQAGAYKAEPSRVFAFEEIAEAHRVMEASQAAGKLVVTGA